MSMPMLIYLLHRIIKHGTMIPVLIVYQLDMEVAASSTTCPCMQDGSIVTTGKNLVCTSGQERVVWESGPAPAPPARERLSPVKLVQDTRTVGYLPYV